MNFTATWALTTPPITICLRIRKTKVVYFGSSEMQKLLHTYSWNCNSIGNLSVNYTSWIEGWRHYTGTNKDIYHNTTDRVKDRLCELQKRQGFRVIVELFQFRKKGEESNMSSVREDDICNSKDDLVPRRWCREKRDVARNHVCWRHAYHCCEDSPEDAEETYPREIRQVLETTW